MTENAPSAAQVLAMLTQRRAAARARVDELEAEQRAATEARETARVALIEFERKGGRPAERQKLERALADAETSASERWPERFAGATAAVRDADQQVRLYATEHIAELVEGLQRDGQMTAERVNTAAEQFLRATQQRAQAEQNLLSVVALTRQNDPRDYNRSKADEAVLAVSKFLQQGGEVGPALRIDLSAHAAA